MDSAASRVQGCVSGWLAAEAVCQTLGHCSSDDIRYDEDFVRLPIGAFPTFRTQWQSVVFNLYTDRHICLLLTSGMGELYLHEAVL
jgi:hypothetical protein